MKKHNIYIFLLLVIISFGCKTTQTVSRASKSESSKVSFKAREYYLKGLFLQAEERFTDALVQFHKAQIFDTTSATIHNSLAENYIKLNEFEPAVYHLKKALHLQSENIDSYRLLGEVYFRQRKDVEAIDAYEQVLRLDPFDDNARNFLFFLYEKTQQPSAKAHLYEELLYLYGNNKLILSQIVEAYEKQNDFPKAIEYLDKIIKLDSTDAENYFKKGLLLENLKRNEEAISIYKKALQHSPDDKEIKGRLAILYRYSNQYQEVIDLLEPTLSQYPDNSGFKLLIAECYYFLENTDKTKEILQPLTKMKSIPWTVYELLGRVELEGKNYDQAIEHFNKVIKMDITNRYGWLFLGFAYSDMGQLKEAEETYRKAVIHVKDDASLWTWLGIVLQRQKKFAESIEPFKKALLLDPKNVNALSSLPVVLEELDLFEQSDDVYEEGIKHLPDNALLLNNFAYSLSERDVRLQEALEMSQKSNDLEPDNAAYLDTIGWIYFKLKEYQKAENFILKSLKLRSSSAVVLDHMGDIYYNLNDIEQAKVYWKKSIEIQPDNQSVLDKIANN